MSTTPEAGDAGGPAGSPAARAGSRRGAGRVAWTVLVAVLAAVFAAGVFAAWDFTVDEVFVVLRYSEHLADGHGPVWNPDGAAVDGTPGLGWAALLAPFAALGLDAELVATVLSVLLGAAVLGGLLVSAGRSAGLPAALVAGAAFTLFLPTYFHLTAGLETAALTAVVFRATVVGLGALAGRPVRAWEPPTWVLLAGVLRPEGVLMTLPPLVVWLWGRGRDRRARFWTASVAALGVAFVVWHWVFYGRPLPGGGRVTAGGVAGGADATWFEYTLLAFAPLVVLTGVLLVRRATRAAGALLAAVVAAGWVGYVLAAPEADFLHRFAFHTYPVLCLGAGLGAVAAWEATSRGAGRAAVPGARAVPVAAAVFTVAWVVMAGVTPRDLPLMANYGPDLERAQVAIGAGLAHADVPPPERTVAVARPGAIPYHSGWQALDYTGRVDATRDGGADPTSVVRRAHPTVVVVPSPGPYVPRTARGLRVPEAVAGYRLLAQVRMREGAWQHVFVLPEWAAPVTTAVAASVRDAGSGRSPERYDASLDRWLERVFGRL